MSMWESFDKNEITLIALNVVIYFVLFLMRKKFTPQVRLISLLWGFTIGILFDFTIGGGLLDYYKVNDLNNYEITDILYYLLFAPFGYFFFYFYETLKIKKKTFSIYVIAWAIAGVTAQWFMSKFDIITLQGGYQLLYSFPIFLLIQTITGIYYELIKKREQLLLIRP